jgi:hypothetical protein
MPRTRVFLDTNVILPAYGSGCWNAICSHFQIETVEKCIEETLTGDNTRRWRIDVPPAELRPPKITAHPVTRQQLAALVSAHPHLTTLDDGEKHLMAWMHANNIRPQDGIYISSADKAALIAANTLGLLDLTYCLEYLAKESGVGQVNLNRLPDQHRSAWLTDFRTQIRMGTVP